MPRPKNPQPNYLHHKPTGQAYCRIPNGNGGRKTVYLGAFNSSESKTEFARILSKLAVAPASVVIAQTGTQRPADITVAEVYLAFWKHAQQHYRREDGTTTEQLVEFRNTFRVALALYGETPAAEFGPLALKSVRQKLVESELSRSVVNDRCRRVRHVFKWAAGEEMVPVAVYQALACVSGLQRGRTTAPDYEDIGPVEDAVVDVTLLHLNRQVRGLVEFQRLTGCRPGEATALRRCDLDMSGNVWMYRPAQHKTKHKGKRRVIAIGPKAQELLTTYFTDTPTDYLFCPRRAKEEHNAARAANRKTPNYPSHIKHNAERKKPNPKRRPTARYTRLAYLNAITRACDRAFPPTGELARRDGETVAKWWARLTTEQRDAVKTWQREHHWHPNQLRHTFATRVRKQHGLEAAQVSLGHARADTTQLYAEKNEALAAQVAAAVG